MMPKYFDTHSHLNFPQFDADRDAVIARMKEQEVWTICVGTSAKTSEESVTRAEAHDGIFATVGIHPTDTEGSFDESFFKRFIGNEKLVGVGECGLDYFREVSQTSHDKERQKNLFVDQIEFALAHNLPLMLHCRPSRGTTDAYEDVLSILSSYDLGLMTRDCVGNVHFFVGTVDIARKFLDLGFTISFDGPITFTHEYDEVVRYVPLDMLLAETDAPFAAPGPHRGTRNEPSFVSYVVTALARIRDEEETAVRQKTVENAAGVWGVSSR